MPLFGVGIKPKTNDKGNELGVKKKEMTLKNKLKTKKRQNGKGDWLFSHFVNSRYWQLGHYFTPFSRLASISFFSSSVELFQMTSNNTPRPGSIFSSPF